MNTYWSNDDDRKVSYTSEQPPRDPRANGGACMPDSAGAPRPNEDPSGAFSYNQPLNRREYRAEASGPPTYTPNYGPDRSSFLSNEADAQHRRGSRQFAPPPKFSGQPQAPQQPPANYPYGDGYQVHSERPQDPGDGRRRGRGWLTFLIVLLILALIGGGTYLFRHQILDLIGQIFGEEVVWKIVPTPAPTEAAADVPAYVKSTPLQIKSRAMQEIAAVAGDVDLNTYVVTDQNIVLRSENPNGTYDYYLFAYDTGRLLGYYEGLRQLIPCDKDIFYISESPYLITARGFPLVGPDAFERSAGDGAVIRPMIYGWAMVSDAQGTMYNYIGSDGALISDLWFSKAFPFTAGATLAYVDTGNVTDAGARYALYLLKSDGGTKRLSYEADMDGVLQSVCGMAFMSSGEMLTLDEELSPMHKTDDVAAYVNCGALAVRDYETGMYGLFVDGVQQYPFEFDEIIPMPSDLTWTETATGYVRRYTVDGLTYPLPRSYSFILRKDNTEQIVSIAAASIYPLAFD